MTGRNGAVSSASPPKPPSKSSRNAPHPTTRKRPRETLRPFAPRTQTFTELLEDGLEHREGIGFLGGGERLAGEEIAAGEVGDRQRIAIASVGEHELALVVGAPQIIGLAGKGKRRSLRPITPPHSALDQAVAIENRMHRADRRRVHI